MNLQPPAYITDIEGLSEKLGPLTPPAPMNAAFSYKTSVLSALFNPLKIEQHKHVLRQLTTDLDVVQNRLGTDKERPADCELARDLGHKIRNKLLILSLWESLGFTEMPPEIRRQITPVAAPK